MTPDRLRRAYALELYAPQSSSRQRADVVGRLNTAAKVMRGEGTAIRYMRSLVLHTDEICFAVFAAPSADAVADAARRAAVAFERVIEVDMAEHVRRRGEDEER
jgi:hypothetical protein